MKIVVVGATGTIGKAVAAALSKEHEVIAASRNSTPPLDIEAPSTVREFFARIGKVDAVVSCAGSGRFAPLEALSDDDFDYSLKGKLMGQVNLARIALDFLNDRGSITLTSGVLANHPTPGSAAISLVNAGVEAFARAAALEAPRGIRVNVVSPPWIAETLKAMGQDPAKGLPAHQNAKAYVVAVSGGHTGQILSSTEFA